MKRVFFYNQGESNIEAFTDRYVYDNITLRMISLIGSDSAVKAIAGRFLKNKAVDCDIWVEEIGNTDRYKRDYFSRDNKAHYKVMTAKLRAGMVHQIIADTRFFEIDPKDSDGTRFVYVGPGEDPYRVVYEAFLKDIPTPMLPEWTEPVLKVMAKNTGNSGYGWKYAEGKARARSVSAYPGSHEMKDGCIMLSASESQLDDVISELQSNGGLSWN